MKSIIKVLLVASVCLCVGCSVAYYNTSSLGYDNANLVSYDSEQLRIFDISIKYNKIFKELEKSKKYIPTNYIAI